MKNILKEKGKAVLLGNEAVTRGALESGVDFVSTYPGTPASEIGNSFYLIKKSDQKVKKTFYFEYSTNEKAAMEAGVGASFSGLKTLVAMKHFGQNVAQEALLPFLYTGSVGPTVVAVSDDPSCHSSAQSEQNTRFMDRLAHVPTLEPATPEEAKEFTKLAFRISEKFNLPVVVRLTTRVSHQRAPVKLRGLPDKGKPKGKFHKNPERFITMPPRVLEMKKELLAKEEKIRKFVETDNVFPGKRKKWGVLTSGVSHLYALEAMRDLDVSLPVFKNNLFFPLQEERIKKFLKGKEKVLVVEELEGILEKDVKRLAKEVNCNLLVRGKDLIPQTGELTPDLVLKAFVSFTGKKMKKNQVSLSEVSTRSPRPCPGCPYWTTFGAVKKATEGENVVFGGDIGCYMLAGIPQLGLQDYLSCMGSGVGIAHGIKKASPDQKVVAFIGDSTFFHSGMTSLANVVFNESDPLIIIMDNRTTAMTGQQPNPGEKMKIEQVVRGLGVKNLAVLDPVKEVDSLKSTIKEFLKKDEAGVIIARSPCLFIRRKN